MKKNNKKGFTLVELVIVVAVMAILVAVAIPTIGSIRSSAQSSVNKSNAQTVESIIKLEEAENDGSAPSANAIAQALLDAKLGIEDEKVFYYDYATGECTAEEKSTDFAYGWVITFGEDTAAVANGDAKVEGVGVVVEGTFPTTGG